MDKMKIYLQQQQDLIVLPINPEKLAMSEKSKNKEKTVIGIGDVNIPELRGLNTLSFDSFFPAHWAHYCAVAQDEIMKPMVYVNKIMQFKNSKTPIKLIFASSNMQNIMLANGNASGQFLIEDMDYEIKAGEENDIYYSIKLKQYRSFEPKVVTIKKETQTSAPTITIKDQLKRPAPIAITKEIKRYTVKSGDNLWNIARTYYGDGNEYQKIVKANKIGTPSLIYPGQVLVIP